MKLSLVNGERREAEKGLSGICIGCEQPMIPKCGSIKMKHWAHKSQCKCDHWWENETEWHRNWKNNFPKECQEIRHKNDMTGEWHIADVKTKQGHIVEFQHSFLKLEERLARNNFYGTNLVWVVDGLKRKNDLEQFDMILKSSRQITQNFPLVLIPDLVAECSLVRDWSECSGPVFFDFGVTLPLWCLLPKSPKAKFYAVPFLRQKFVDLLKSLSAESGQGFSEFMKVLNDLVFSYENPQQPIKRQETISATNRLAIRRPIAIPQNPSRRYLYYLNRSPRRYGRF